MDYRDFKWEFRRLRRSKSLRSNSKLPKEVFEFGWKIAQFKPQQWIVERILFWIFAYDKTHKWTKQDFLYEINDEAWAKARAKRKERKEARIEAAKAYHNKVRPFPKEKLTCWSECSGPPPELFELQKRLNENGSQ